MAFPQQFGGFRVPGGGGQTASLGQMGANVDMSKAKYARGAFAPAFTLANMYQSPEAQAWLNPADLASTMGVESALAGRQVLGRQAGNMAASQGMGPGFAAGMEQQATQQAFADIASALQEAQMLQQDRQFMASRDMADAITQGQHAMFMRNQQRRGSKGGAGGLVGGGIGAALGAAVGTMVAPGIGTAIGAGMGGSMGGSMGASVDQMQGRFSPQPNFSSLMMMPMMMQMMGGGGGPTTEQSFQAGQQLPWLNAQGLAQGATGAGNFIGQMFAGG